MFGRKQRRIEALERRVKELEEKICPLNSHEWVRTDTEYFFNGVTVDTYYVFRCNKCGKEKVDWI